MASSLFLLFAGRICKGRNKRGGAVERARREEVPAGRHCRKALGEERKEERGLRKRGTFSSGNTLPRFLWWRLFAL